MTKELVIKDDFKISQPSKMSEMAGILKTHIVNQKLYTTISGKNYVHVEGWQFAGGMLGIFPKVTEVEDLSKENEIKWKATVELIDRSGNVVSTGFAICSNKEIKKRGFAEYAVLSMAQTRAIGKAYRNIIGWVMKLAGYESTPSEEMSDKTVEKKTKEVEEIKKTTASSINNKLDNKTSSIKEKINSDPKYKSNGKEVSGVKN